MSSLVGTYLSRSNMTRIGNVRYNLIFDVSIFIISFEYLSIGFICIILCFVKGLSKLIERFVIASIWWWLLGWLPFDASVGLQIFENFFISWVVRHLWYWFHQINLSLPFTSLLFNTCWHGSNLCLSFLLYRHISTMTLLRSFIFLRLFLSLQTFLNDIEYFILHLIIWQKLINACQFT